MLTISRLPTASDRSDMATSSREVLNGEPGGIPTIRLSGTLRVPSAALDDFVRMGRVVTRDDLRRPSGRDRRLLLTPARWH
jgi:hypothetical protein